VDRRIIGAAVFFSACWISASTLIKFGRVQAFLPSGDWTVWFRGVGMLWAIVITGTFVILLLYSRLDRPVSPGRRQFFKAAQGAILAAPAVLTGHGVLVGRKAFQLREVDIALPHLPRDLQGLRILHLSDLHMSPFFGKEDLIRVIDMANETNPHLAVVTGDLVTGPRDPLELCLQQLSRLKTGVGVLGCLGNHEIFARAQARTKTLGARLGMNFLRHESQILRFGESKLNVVGVDYQPFRTPYLTGAEKLTRPDSVNLLLSHNPDVFEAAAAKGYALTLAGHTHGGQITVEILHQWANVARMFTPYVHGLYRKEASSLYVTRGIGTVGIPARLGAPPEITVIRLCAS
jgi:predicted MPP superfamily phosphohydrolase